jgi:hypothetical protein
MVHSLNPTIVVDDNNLTDAGFTLGETIRFESLEFTTGRFGYLSLYPEGSDPCAVFVEMVQSGSPSLHTIL